MKIGVLLSGCGVYDGAEIHESVFTLLAIDEIDAEAVCISIDKPQHHVIDHTIGEEMNETRNMLKESARIARGNIKNITDVDPADIDALVIPGGFGSAKNFSDWAFNGPDGTILPEVKLMIVNLINIGKPIAALCVSPVLIAKALSHEPDVLFLDEPTAGVDVELRKDMWKTIKNLQKSGVTIILTTHYIEEAELMANRIAVINNGKILLIDKKDNLIDRMSKKTLTIHTNIKINKIDDSLFKFNLRIGRDKKSLEYDYSPNKKKTGITSLLNQIKKTGIELVDVQTKQSSLEQIFVEILKND